MAYDDLTQSSMDFSISETDEEKLTSMRAHVNWEIEAERHDFYGQLCDSIKNCQGRVPNLRLIFRKEEINWLLVQCVQFGPTELINFVISTGYRDESNLDEQGQPRWHCMTPLLHAAVHRKGLSVFMVYKLFKIYNRFDINYTDDNGLSHFHAACLFGCEEVIEKFLDLGQDANCLVRTTGMSPLHLAVANKRRDVADVLLRRGANPNLANNKGLTALHMICGGDRGHTVEVSLECERLRKTLYMTYGASSFRAAQYNFECIELVKLLVRSGADPNLIDKHGRTPLHIIAHGNDNGWLVKKFSEICRDARDAVRLDAVERSDGRTPLHLALSQGNRYAAETLLRRGADPNSADAKGFTSLHYMASRKIDDDLADWFLALCAKIRSKVEVDARNKFGNTPLLLAQRYALKNVVKTLLRRGAKKCRSVRKGNEVQKS